MKLLFLIPPSEGKNMQHTHTDQKNSFIFEKPLDIARQATQKDLKCIWNRFAQAIELNKSIQTSPTLKAIHRYSGVMYNAIWYDFMENDSQKYFDTHFAILSGMYGIVAPQDLIANYKLPIETKGLYNYWKEQITQKLNESDVDYIVDLLPGSYLKMIDLKTINKKIIRINFLKTDGKKIAHGVKKIKGQWIQDICKNQPKSISDFWNNSIIWEKIIDINLTFDL